MVKNSAAHNASNTAVKEVERMPDPRQTKSNRECGIARRFVQREIPVHANRSRVAAGTPRSSHSLPIKLRSGDYLPQSIRSRRSSSDV
jgi:hypothetical protein